MSEDTISDKFLDTLEDTYDSLGREEAMALIGQLLFIITNNDEPLLNEC
jgi:hypothetical protein